MSDWLKVKAADVVELIERRKDRLPWGYRPEEIYRCLIFQKDGRIFMTVDQFRREENGGYACLRPYTAEIAETMEDYRNMPDEAFVKKASTPSCRARGKKASETRPCFRAQVRFPAFADSAVAKQALYKNG